MSEAKSKLLELKEALEKAIKMPSTAPVLPSLKPPKIPTAPKIDTATTPKQPSLAPSSKKDPIKVAQQLQDPHLKASALKIAKNGQWSLENLEKAGTESQYLLLKATFNQLKIRVENELPAISSPHFKPELVEKGLKSTIAGAVLAGSALLPSKAIAAPIKAPIPVSQVSEVRPDSNTGNMMSTGSKPSPKGGEATIRTSEYGPYKITSSYQPHVEDGNTSQKMTHQVSWNGTPSPKHLAAVSKEYGIDVNNLQSLKANPSHATGLDGKPSGDTYIKSTSKDIHSPSKGQPAGYLHQ